MPVSQSDQLFKLVKSLTKAEKRNFKLYTGRTQAAEDSMFVQLFDILDNAKTFDAKDIRKKMSHISKSQLSNLKRHLYSQILTSLRLIYIKNDISIEIREQLDFARILYSKGLYMQALKIITRVKNIARNANQDLLFFEILEFEKMIEEKHITRSRKVQNKVESLIEESTHRLSIVEANSKLTNLKLEIHGLYIKVGHAKDRKQAEFVKEFFHKSLSEIDQENLSFFEKTYLHQAYVWYYYILLDFENCKHHAQLWVQNFHENREMISHNPDNYLRSMHYLFTSYYYLGETSNCDKTLNLFDEFEKKYSSEINITTEIFMFLYKNYSFLDFMVISGQYERAIKEIPKIKSKLTEYSSHLDQHRSLTFYYRFAWLYFATEQYNEAIDYLNAILNLKMKSLREDIQGYTWLLFLLCHYEKSNFRLLGHLIPSASRFFEKMREKNLVQTEIMNFIKTQLRPGQRVDKEVLTALKNNLLKITQNPYENKSLLYLDAIKWVDAKLKKTSIAELDHSVFNQPIAQKL